MNNKTQNTEPIIEVKDLMKSFGDNHVLINFNLVLNKGENLIIMGKSGSGKSVLIKCIIGLEKADGGTIMVMGKKINELDRTTLDELRTEVGFLFQGSALYDSMTVRENLEFPLRAHKKIWCHKGYKPLSSTSTGKRRSCTHYKFNARRAFWRYETQNCFSKNINSATESDPL